MHSRFGNYGNRLITNIEDIQNQWRGIFGKDFINVFQNTSPCINTLVDHVKEILDLNSTRKGYATLFLRDPISDRLVLEYSTNHELNQKPSTPPSEQYFHDMNSNFDGDREHCFYDLKDRLATQNEKKSESSRKTRGLTGWVAISGQHVMINNERAAELLEDIPRNNPDAEPSCRIYGAPIWGARISEHPKGADDKPWSKRYLAVPIKLISNEDITIGVLRYTCTIMQGDELSELDLQYLESIAEIISTLRNIERAKMLATREDKLQQEILAFEATGDFSKFLEFIAKSFGSKIASLYIYLKTNKKPILRLVDAFGISGYTGELRNQGLIHDYASNTHGLTWELLGACEEPRVESSVINNKEWGGLNTELFYKKGLSGISRDVDHKLATSSMHKELLSAYQIKLMGLGFEESGASNLLGVMKVEFPSTFDGSEHYDKNDEAFFIACGQVLKEELAKYQSFIEGMWFKDADGSNANEFARFMNQIIRFHLVKEDEKEFSDFWSNVRNYSRQYEKEIQTANDTAFKRLPIKEQRFTIKGVLGAAPEWLGKVLFSEFVKVTLRNF